MFLLNMAFISLSEVENSFHFTSGEVSNEINIFFTSQVKAISNKNDLIFYYLQSFNQRRANFTFHKLTLISSSVLCQPTWE